MDALNQNMTTAQGDVQSSSLDPHQADTGGWAVIALMGWLVPVSTENDF